MERQYAELVRRASDLGVRLPRPDYGVDLSQPSPLEIVQNVTTYGAYEKPI